MAKTITYSKVDNHEIQFDLYLPPGASGSLPAFIFFHGGGMVAGGRGEGDIFYQFWMRDSLLKKNIIYISANYRLIHPSTGFDIIEDVKSLFSFLSSPSFSTDHLPDGVTLDSTRIAVSGGSAGGYPALAAGVHINPKPKAVLPFYGMGGSFLLDFWIQEKNENMSFFGAENATKENLAHLLDPEKVQLASNAPIIEMVRDKDSRMLLFPYWWRTGELVDYVLGRPGLSASLRAIPFAEREKAIPEELKPALLETQLDANFPPTFLIHGRDDPIVLVDESQKTYETLKSLGVDVQLHVLDGAVHGLFGKTLPPALAPGAEELQEKALQWVEERLKA